MSNLWAGIDLKLDHARFHLESMSKALQEPPNSSRVAAALSGSSSVLQSDWHRAFYAHLDAFLSAARSIPEIIRCCFGIDPMLMDWFVALDQDERERRKKFGLCFKTDYDDFRKLPLGIARHISVHRTGVAPVKVTITGRFGVTYIGDPTTRVPTIETRPIDAGFDWLVGPTTIRPRWSDFKIDDLPLFETCDAYVRHAEALIHRARALAEDVHRSSTLTTPPSEM